MGCERVERTELGLGGSSRRWEKLLPGRAAIPEWEDGRSASEMELIPRAANIDRVIDRLTLCDCICFFRSDIALEGAFLDKIESEGMH